jgi:hypothetical protein
VDAYREETKAIRSWDGTTGGWGIKDTEITEHMKNLGYEVVDEGKHYYKNTATGEYVNVDGWGGDYGSKTKEITVAGEKQTATTWSDEYVRYLTYAKGLSDDVER